MAALDGSDTGKIGKQDVFLVLILTIPGSRAWPSVTNTVSRQYVPTIRKGCGKGI